MKKECVRCNETFVARTSRAMYCSDRCRKYENVVCNQCKKGFSRQRNLKSVPYCSVECRGIGKKTIQKLNCDFCNKSFTRQSCFVNRAEASYCSVDCQHKGSTTVPLATCERCGSKYKELGENRRYCSMKCRRVTVSKEKLEKYYVEQGLSAESVGIQVGASESSVLKSLEKFNIPARNSNMVGDLLCKDGHKASSSYEKIFDDKLTDNGLEHHYDVPLPFHNRYRTDFLVEDVYIEVWGVVGSEKYDLRRKAKQRLYKENNCKLVNVYPEDFKDIDIKIEEVKRLLE